MFRSPFVALFKSIHVLSSFALHVICYVVATCT